MLSRIAESLYWIGRYVERAEDTSRIVDVHLSLLLEDPWAPEDVVCALAAVGHGPRADRARSRRGDVLEALVWDCVDAGVGDRRASAPRARTRRRSREVVSSELWESINVTWHEATAARRGAPTRTRS